MPQQELDLTPPQDPAAETVVEELQRLDTDGLSPRDALALIFSLKDKLRARR